MNFLLNIAEFYLKKKSDDIKNVINPTNSYNKNSVSIGMRRILSEVRDNLIETNSYFNNAYKRMRNAASALTSSKR